jgi:16S rRNA C1402 N4-methylase RsmH
LDEIKALLEAAPKLLKPSARLVVISFHSLGRSHRERQSAGRRAEGNLGDSDQEAGHAGEEEMGRNPRSRSAKLRAAGKNSSNRDRLQRWELQDFGEHGSSGKAEEVRKVKQQ